MSPDGNRGQADHLGLQGHARDGHLTGMRSQGHPQKVTHRTGDYRCASAPTDGAAIRRTYSAICRHGRPGAQLLCSLYVASDLPGGRPAAFRSPGAPASAGAPPRAWPAPGAAAARPKLRRIAPRRAALAPCTGPGAPGANPVHDPHRLSPLIACPLAEPGRPDPLRRRQESPAKGTTQPHQCKGQRGGKGTFFLVRAFRVRLGIRLQQVMPAIPPCAGTRSQPADRHIVPLRCCILLLYKARERWAQDFEFICLTWGGAKGIRTPDLLHAMNPRQVP